MSKIIKIVDLTILCIPKFIVKKERADMITRIELAKKQKIHFNTKAGLMHFRQMYSEGIVKDSKIRFFRHNEFPEHMFYVQVKTLDEYNKLSNNDQRNFFSLSAAKKDTCCVAKSLLEALNIDCNLNNDGFDSDKITKVLSDEGWIFEIDISSYIKNMKRA